jgi:hypothetical protein
MLVAPSNPIDDRHVCPWITVPSLEEVPVPTLRQTAAIVLAMLTLTLALAACSRPAATPDPTADLTPNPTPAATATARAYTDAEQADILAENIDRVYAEDTQYVWYPAFVDLTVTRGWAYVRSTLTEADADLADSMCADIADVAFENFTEPIGVTHVLISAGEFDLVDLVDCDVPSR